MASSLRDDNALNARLLQCESGHEMKIRRRRIKPSLFICYQKFKALPFSLTITSMLKLSASIAPISAVRHREPTRGHYISASMMLTNKILMYYGAFQAVNLSMILCSVMASIYFDSDVLRHYCRAYAFSHICDMLQSLHSYFRWYFSVWAIDRLGIAHWGNMRRAHIHINFDDFISR